MRDGDGIPAPGRAKRWQLALFAANGAAASCYYLLTVTGAAYHAERLLGLSAFGAALAVTAARLLSALAQPLVGRVLDRPGGRFGRLRPLMLLGNALLAVSALLLYFLLPRCPLPCRRALFAGAWLLYAGGYALQTGCTRCGQALLTKDPAQRPAYTLFNTLACAVGPGALGILCTVAGSRWGYASAAFYRAVAPAVVTVSAAFTLLAAAAIRQKDVPAPQNGAKAPARPGGQSRAALRLMFVAGCTRLAYAVSTATAVGCMVYGGLMQNYGRLVLLAGAAGYGASAPFFLAGNRIARRRGQKAALQWLGRAALLGYAGLGAVLALWRPQCAVRTLCPWPPNGYTLAFLLFYSLGFGAQLAAVDLPVPMAADCIDYEHWRTGRRAAGRVGAWPALTEQLASAASTAIVGAGAAAIGLKGLPNAAVRFCPGMHGLALALFCMAPALLWAAALWALRRYPLTGHFMEKVRRDTAQGLGKRDEGR